MSSMLSPYQLECPDIYMFVLVSCVSAQPSGPQGVFLLLTILIMKWSWVDVAGWQKVYNNNNNNNNKNNTFYLLGVFQKNTKYNTPYMVQQDKTVNPKHHFRKA